MARVPSHLIQRGGVYNYRRRVPADLQSRPEFSGRDVYQVSLGVRTLTEARRRVQQLGLDDLFRSPNSLPQTPDTGTIITTPLLRQIADENYHRGLASLRRRTNEQGGDDDGEPMADELAAQNVGSLNNPASAARTRAFLRRELSPLMEAQAEGIAANLGIEPTKQAIDQIKDALFESEIGLEGARVDLAGGHAFPSWSSGGRSNDRSETAPVAREAHWTFKKLAAAAMRQHPKGASWEHKVRTVADLFDEYHGPLPIYKIDRRKVRDFVNDLQFMPVSMTQRFPGLTLKQAIKANDEREKPYRAISPNTARDGYFSILRWSFNHAVELEAVAANPCTGIRFKGATKGSGRRSRNPFTVQELNAFFRLPVFTGCKSEHRPNTPGDFTFSDHRKWAPLIMLFTGARTSEVAQLAVSDIKSDAAHPYISILTEYDPDDPDEDRSFVVSHKTENARRDVPLHPQLVELGFLHYIAARKANGEPRVFPDWKLPADGRKLYSSAPWVRNVNDKQIPTITTRHPKPTLYSFRHTWKTQMATSQVPAQYQNQVLGHAQQGMDDRYLGTMSIAHIYEAVSRVTFDGLDLKHLKSL